MNKMDIAMPIGVHEVKALDVIQSHGRFPLVEVFGLVHRQPLLNLFHLIDAGVTNGIHTVLGPQGRAMH